MKTISNMGIFLVKLLLNIISVILLLIIILNIGVILETRVMKADYPSLLDYTYFIVESDNKNLNLNEGDLLLIDMRVTVEKEDLVMYKNELGYHIEKVSEVDKEVTLSNNETIPKEQIAGKQIKQLAGMGTTLESILKPMTLIISIVLLTVTSIIQSFINKKTKKENPKPNFNQTW